MKNIFKQIILVVICFCLASCSVLNNNNEYENSDINDNTIHQDIIEEETVVSGSITLNYVKDNVIQENNIYECRLDNNTISQSYIFEITISDGVEDLLASYLPSQINNYDIDWKGVFRKFAIGTTVVVAVGVINWGISNSPLSKRNTYYLFASPADVLESAFKVGVIYAASNIVLNSIKNGKLPEQGIKKYVIEGFAQGYMYGAISSALVLREKEGNINKKYPPNSQIQVGEGFESKVIYTDDNGKIYREGDALIANSNYTLNGYDYTTDGLGRISKVEANKLKLKQANNEGLVNRDTICDTKEAIGKGYQVDGDDRGHLIGDKFGGDNSLANIVSMNGNVNKSEYKKIENILARALREGKDVKLEIVCEFLGNSFRPEAIELTYKIGRGAIEVFKIINTIPLLKMKIGEII